MISDGYREYVELLTIIKSASALKNRYGFYEQLHTKTSLINCV